MGGDDGAVLAEAGVVTDFDVLGGDCFCLARLSVPKSVKAEFASLSTPAVSHRGKESEGSLGIGSTWHQSHVMCTCRIRPQLLVEMLSKTEGLASCR